MDHHSYDDVLALAREKMNSDQFTEIFGEFPEISHGVFGDIVERQGYIFINVIWSAVENQGNVGRYLDSLPKDKEIVVPVVMSAKFAGMLQRRGFTETHPEYWTRRNNVNTANR